MTYRTSREVFNLVTKAEYPSKLHPILQKLNSAGAFSNRLAGLIDRMQEDESFRRKLLSDQTSVQEIGISNRLEAHEMFALVAAANMLDPTDEWPDKGMSIKVAPSCEELTKRYKSQPLDAGLVREDRMEKFSQMMVKDLKYRQLVAEQPVLALGPHGLNRSEFVMIYIQAAMLQMVGRREKSLTVSSDFLKISGITETELSQIVNNWTK